MSLYHLKKDEEAKKHGKSSNPKSNFKYLINNKTNKTIKTNKSSKENELESVSLNTTYQQIQKTINKAGRVRTECQ